MAGSHDSIADALSSMGDSKPREDEQNQPQGDELGEPRAEAGEVSEDELLSAISGDGEVESAAVGFEEQHTADPSDPVEAQDVLSPPASDPVVEPVTKARTAASKRAVAQRKKPHKLAVPLLMGMGALMLVIASWATALLLGLEVPMSEREDASSMATMFLVAWPMAILLLVFGYLMVLDGKPKGPKKPR